MKSIVHYTVSAFAALVLIAPHAEAVETASDFTITNRATGKEIRRDDFKGKIVFLDLFAYWCPPCASSSPVVETEIAKYYQSRGGNPHGVEVEVVGVNIESESPSSTDSFISKVGFKTVADDFGNSGAWAQFGQGGIPHFVIINGVKGGSHQEWEVLHSDSGFRGSAFYRNLMDSIKPGEEARSPEIEVQNPPGSQLKDGESKRSFGTVLVRSKSAAKTFIIKNRGKANLSGLGIAKGGIHRSDFTAGPLGKTTLLPGEQTTFKVTFAPKGKGKRTASIKISSNDSDENPFDIPLAGMGVNGPFPQ